MESVRLRASSDDLVASWGHLPFDFPTGVHLELDERWRDLKANSHSWRSWRHRMGMAAAAQMKRLGMNDPDILEVMGWTDVTMLRRYTAAVATELAQAAHIRYSPADAL